MSDSFHCSKCTAIAGRPISHAGECQRLTVNGIKGFVRVAFTAQDMSAMVAEAGDAKYAIGSYDHEAADKAERQRIAIDTLMQEIRNAATKSTGCGCADPQCGIDYPACRFQLLAKHPGPWKFAASQLYPGRANIKDANEQYVAHCPDEETAQWLVAMVNGHGKQ